MTRSANLGFPRIGLHRELKKALESYWKGATDAASLHATGQALRARHWQLQKDAGIDIIPSNDFSFYDHMLDMTAALGAVPRASPASTDAARATSPSPAAPPRPRRWR